MKYRAPNRYHILSRNHQLGLQSHFIFLDSEAHIEELKDGGQKQTFRLACAEEWDREKDLRDDVVFHSTRKLWDWVERSAVEHNEVFVYAHNMEYDFKLCNGYRDLIDSRRWRVEQIYINQNVFMLTLQKDGRTIRFYDTMNYVPMSLEKLGAAIGLKKGKVDFKTVGDEELIAYCKQDVRIISGFIWQLCDFVRENNLTRLRPTAAGMALSSFRHRFYDETNMPIHIHDHWDCIALERASYRGGVTDCLKVGRFTERLHKLDINSMYPYIMRTEKVPVEMILHTVKPKECALYADMIGRGLDVIVRAEIELPSKYAYILTRYKLKGEEKTGFISGKFTTVLTTPELEYVLKRGKVHRVLELAAYRKALAFKDYVDFFYGKRLEYEKKGNKAFALLCKMCLNSLYGKFGQRQSESIEYEKNAPSAMSKSHVETASRSYTVLHIGRQVIYQTQTEDNSFEAFVAVASFITAHARMRLIRLIEKAGRKNTYYLDTDCLIVNDEGLRRLKGEVDNVGKTLGKLKSEGISSESIFYRPKYYLFGGDLKCKGVKKDAQTVSETPETWTIQQKQFEKFKTSLKNGVVDRVDVRIVEKKIDKVYDKGHVAGVEVIPYDAQEVEIRNI